MLLKLTSPDPDSLTRGWYARTTNAAVRQARQATTITNENSLDKLYRTHTRMMSTTGVLSVGGARIIDERLAINCSKVDLKTR